MEGLIDGPGVQDQSSDETQMYVSNAREHVVLYRYPLTPEPGGRPTFHTPYSLGVTELVSPSCVARTLRCLDLTPIPTKIRISHESSFRLCLNHRRKERDIENMVIRRLVLSSLRLVNFVLLIRSLLPHVSTRRPSGLTLITSSLDYRGDPVFLSSFITKVLVPSPSVFPVTLVSPE